MCREHIRLMRQSRCSQRNVTVTTSSAAIVSRSANRVCLILGSDPSTGYYVFFGTRQESAAGLYIPAGAEPTILDINSVGIFCQGDIYAITAAGSAAISVVETEWSDNG